MTVDLLPIEQHFHGAFGVNFSNCKTEDVLYVAKKMKESGIGGIFPTLVTDTVENIKKQTEVIKQAAAKQTDDMAKIYGIHLEGIFINPLKKGIHDEKLFLEPSIENYKLVEDDFIKIVTLAPELAAKGLIDYLNSKGIKVQAGHCTGGNLTGCTGVTHLFNAMSGITHRGESTALSALTNDDIYVEIIADGVHVSDEALKLVFKSKPTNKILLVSDCLSCAGTAPCEFEFAGEKIYYDGKKATSKDGTLAGSSTLLTDIIKRLKSIGLYGEQLIKNTYEYHKIEI